jgi:DNA polymerase III alpha subunit
MQPEAVFEAAFEGHDVWSIPNEGGELLDQYNALCRKFSHEAFVIEEAGFPNTTPEEEHARRAADWLIREDIRNIEVRQFLLDLCKTDVERARVHDEMDLFEERDLIPLLQLMMYLVEHFRDAGVVWGVGRGSSVASYCLYLIGVHRVDSIRFGLDVREFLKA